MDHYIDAFVYSTLPGRVLFGTGRRAEANAEAVRLGCLRPLVITTAEQSYLGESVMQLFDTGAASLFPGAAMHTPWDVTVRAMAEMKRTNADCIIAVGGGSSIGLSKAIALQTDLPQIVLPTTYAGSEVTSIIGQTRDGEKHTQRTPKVLPEVVIYDVELTLSLPVPMSVASGLNAIAHAIEALYAKDGNPIISLLAEEGIVSLASALPALAEAPLSIDARQLAQYGAWLCGTCLGAVTMGLHHKICHVLGGTFDLPHAQTHAVMIAHIVAYNAGAAPDALKRVGRALNADVPWTGLYELAASLGAARSLRELGMPEAGIDQAVDLVMQSVYPNPRALDATSLRAMLHRAWQGLPPTQNE